MGVTKQYHDRQAASERRKARQQYYAETAASKVKRWLDANDRMSGSTRGKFEGFPLEILSQLVQEIEGRPSSGQSSLYSWRLLNEELLEQTGERVDNATWRDLKQKHGFPAKRKKAKQKGPERKRARRN